MKGYILVLYTVLLYYVHSVRTSCNNTLLANLNAQLGSEVSDYISSVRSTHLALDENVTDTIPTIGSLHAWVINLAVSSEDNAVTLPLSLADNSKPYVVTRIGIRQHFNSSTIINKHCIDSTRVDNFNFIKIYAVTQDEQLITYPNGNTGGRFYLPHNKIKPDAVNYITIPNTLMNSIKVIEF